MVDGTGHHYAYAVGDSGTILFADADWVEIDSPTEADLYGIWGRATDDVLAVGAAGTILHFDGDNWSAQDRAVEADLYGISGNDEMAVVVGEDGVVLKNEGNGWVPSPSGTLRDLHDVWVSPSGEWYAVGDSGTVIMHD